MKYIKNAIFILLLAVVTFWGVIIVSATMTEHVYILDKTKKFVYSGYVLGSNAVDESIEFTKPVMIHQITIAGNGLFASAEDFEVYADTDSTSSTYEVKLLDYDLGTNSKQYYRVEDEVGWFIPSGGNCVLEYTNTDDNDIYYRVEGYEYLQSN